MLNFSVCAGGGGAGGYLLLLLLLLMFFSNSELNTKSFSCQTNIIWKNISIDIISNANIFIKHTKGKPVYQ